MKYTCPMCEAGGDISKDDLAHPVTRTTCRNCGTILLINPDTGKVDAHKSPIKDSSAIKTSASALASKSASGLSTSPEGGNSRDWTAIVLVVIILIILISAGVYFVFRPGVI